MFCVVKSKSIKYFLVVLLAGILLAISINGASNAEVFFGYSTRKVPIYSVQTEEKQVAISFDAAWGADKTKQIVDICKEYNVKAYYGSVIYLTFWQYAAGKVVLERKQIKGMVHHRNLVAKLSRILKAFCRIKKILQALSLVQLAVLLTIIIIFIVFLIVLSAFFCERDAALVPFQRSLAAQGRFAFLAITSA